MSLSEPAGESSAGNTTRTVPQVADVLQRYGRCLELIPVDPHFQDISVGLYVKDGIYTVWSFSSKAGVEKRLTQIRNQTVTLGGLEAVESSPIQVKMSCGDPHLRPLKFLMAQAVSKSPGYTLPQGSMSIKDTRSNLILSVSGEEQGDRYVYHVSGEGEAANGPLRLKAVVAGFVRYGDMEKVGEAEVSFACGQRHNGLMRILLPYSRNVSAIENMAEEEALRGQMTTSTLGFSQT